MRVYSTSSDRTGDADHVAEISETDSNGLKIITEATSSDWGGTVDVLAPIADTTTWDVAATVLELPLADQFMRPLTNYIVSRCFDIDSEDAGDNNLASKYYSLFRSEVV